MSLKTPPKKKRRNTKGKRSAYILTGALITMMVLRLVAGLARPTSSAASRSNRTATPAAVGTPTAQEIAASSLKRFFQLLHDQRYAEATTYYGGSYDELAALNPDDADSHANLLQNACTQNGFHCLIVNSVSTATEIAPGTYNFSVEFAQEDGSLLVRPSDEAGAGTFSFPFTVKQVDGDYLVQELPVQ